MIKMKHDQMLFYKKLEQLRVVSGNGSKWMKPKSFVGFRNCEISTLLEHFSSAFIEPYKLSLCGNNYRYFVKSDVDSFRENVNKELVCVSIYLINKAIAS